VRPHPQGAVARGSPSCKNRQDEFDIPASQRTQVNVNRIELTFVSFTEWAPIGLDRVGSGLIIETEYDIAISGSAFAVDDRAEAVTALHSECRVEALNVSVLNILREGEQAGTRVSGSRFESGIAHFEHKALGIAICSRAG